MLLEFKTKNFKNFQKELHFKLCDAASYDYNTDVIKDGVVNTAMVYGRNGSGKTNLGLAIFDIILHLTDKEKALEQYKPYKNLYSEDNALIEFYYKFKFDSHILEYEYAKRSPDTLAREKLSVDGKDVIYYNYETHESLLKLKGAETLNKTLTNTNISFVKYVYSNTVLDLRTTVNKTFLRFMSFVNNMLFFSSLEVNRYRGFDVGVASVPGTIVKAGKVKDFEKFLAEVADIQYTLVSQKKDENDWIFCKFGEKLIDFYAVASRGTTSLALFYFWLIEFEKVSLVYIDEYDAFYHFQLAKALVERVKQFKNTQAIFSTQNTDVMTSDILRPDCYYIINNGKIDRLNDLTDKDLRKAHDLQRMYKAGAFNVF